MHRWFVLGFLRSRPPESNDSQGEELPKSSKMNKRQYWLKKGISLFYYFFTGLATGSVETEIKNNGSVPASIIYVEKIIVVALTVFLFFTLLLYGGSTTAKIVNYPQGPE